LARALQRSRDEAADKARRDLDDLKLEYRGKEERFVLDGDRRQLHSIKAELDALRRRATDDEDRARVARDAAQQAVHAAMAAAPRAPRARASPRAVFDDDALDAINGNAAYDGGAPQPPPKAPTDRRRPPPPTTTADQLARLKAERSVLVDDAGYPESDPLVRDLDRLIAAAAE